MPQQIKISYRIKMRDKNLDKLKSSVENLVIAHDGSFTDEQVGGGKVKGKYERKIKNESLRFHYTWHNNMSSSQSKNNQHTQLKRHLPKLKIKKHLPSFKLKNGLSGDIPLLEKRRIALDAFDDALREWEEQPKECRGK